MTSGLTIIRLAAPACALAALAACSSHSAPRYIDPPVVAGQPQPFEDEVVSVYQVDASGDTAFDVTAASGSFFDPFMIDLHVEDSAQHAALAPVYAESTPVDQNQARRYADAAVELYGRTPPQLQASGPRSGATVLDGLESLQQSTFSTEGADFDPCISRDGKTIFFASTQHRATADIYQKSINGTSVTQLTADPAHDVMPAVSPDGSRVVFTSNRTGSWDLFVMSSEGGQAAQLTSTSAHELHPSWSPDGSHLVFCRLGEVSGRWEMWVMDVNQPATSEFIGYGLFPEWCPVAGTGSQGRDQILFQRSRERGDRRFSIWTVDYRADDTSSPTEILSSSVAAVINPTWSRDGERIAFSTVPNPALSGMDADAQPVSADVWMIDTDGSNRVNVTKGRFVNVMPTWSPAGRIYFVSDREGVDNIWSIGTSKAVYAATGRSPEQTTVITEAPTP